MLTIDSIVLDAISGSSQVYIFLRSFNLKSSEKYFYFNHKQLSIHSEQI